MVFMRTFTYLGMKGPRISLQGKSLVPQIGLRRSMVSASRCKSFVNNN